MANDVISDQNLLDEYRIDLDQFDINKITLDEDPDLKALDEIIKALKERK